KTINQKVLASERSSWRGALLMTPAPELRATARVSWATRAPACAVVRSAPIMAADGGSFPAALPCAFSPRARQYLALCAQDGRLRIWSTDSRALHQEYVPSAHLSATCTCVAWGPCRATKVRDGARARDGLAPRAGPRDAYRHMCDRVLLHARALKPIRSGSRNEGPQRKKRKSDTGHVAEQTDLLALGTASGTVLIYSMVKGDLHCTLDGGHSDGVNCVQWHPEDSLFYSGSDDTHIVEWDLQTGRTRWCVRNPFPLGCICAAPQRIALILPFGAAVETWQRCREVLRESSLPFLTAPFFAVQIVFTEPGMRHRLDTEPGMRHRLDTEPGMRHRLDTEPGMRHNRLLRLCPDSCVKWKADRAAVTSLCVSPDGKLLLSAGRSIKMWDLATKEVYRKFTGHCTTVTNLCFATTRPPDSDALYFLSGASHDRLLSVWQVRSDGRDKDSVVSFTLTDEPRHVDLQTSNSKDEAVRLAVVCKDGQLHIFEHFLNGPCKKPLSPVCSLQVSTLRSGDTPLPVPLLTASLCADRQRLLLAYGSHLQPVLETTPINMSERHVCLIRDLNTAHSLSVDTAVSKVKTPIVNDQKSKVLMPGLPGHQAPIRAAPSQSEKRKKGAGTKEMSIEERLEQIELGASGTGGGGERVSTSLQTDGYAVLLVQALESRDAKMMNKILQTKKEYVIRNTIARIPPPAVLPLVEELSGRLQGHPFAAILIVPWLKAVLTQHTSYLSSLPDLVAQLGTLYHAIESRVKVYQQLTRLHGKLYLLMTQVATSKRSQRVEDLDHTARLVYEEDSSDEDEGSGDDGLPEEDSDSWEEEDDEEGMDVAEERKPREDEESYDEDTREEPKANGDSDFDPENESEEE
ncbi:hypothetical protein P4O66_011397, partial [Electrophorus voltai]